MLLGRRFDLDFLARPGITPLAALLLVVGVLGCTVAVWWSALAMQSAHAAIERRDQARAELDRVHRDSRPSHAIAARNADTATLTQLTEMMSALHRPWRALFEQLESTPAKGVYLQLLGVDAHFDNLQMEAEARKLGEILQYTQNLQGHGPIQAVQLSSDEVLDAPGGTVVVARMTARLRAGADAGIAAPASATAKR